MFRKKTCETGVHYRSIDDLNGLPLQAFERGNNKEEKRHSEHTLHLRILFVAS